MIDLSKANIGDQFDTVNGRVVTFVHILHGCKWATDHIYLVATHDEYWTCDKRGRKGYTCETLYDITNPLN